MSGAAAVIEGRGLRVTRGGSVIVDVPSLTVEEGEVLSLIGPNGAGKTTLLQTVSYLTKPFEGDLFFRGRRVGPECPVLTYRRAIAMVFQEPLLFDATVFENVASGLKIRGMKRVSIRQAVAESLSRFGIAPPVGPLGPEPLGRGGPEDQPGPRLCHPPRHPAPR